MSKGLNTNGGNNRYRYQTTKSRLNELQSSLELSTKFSSIFGKEEDDNTKEFYEELLFLTQMCLDSKFKKCSWELRQISQNTAQTIYHLPQIVEILNRNLVPEDREILPSVLRLVVSLARDLGNEFYPHFPVLLRSIVECIDSDQLELTAEVFKTIAQLFKHLHKPLLSDLNTIRDYYAPLLGHPREFVRNFAGHTFSFLIRKIKNRKQLKMYIRTLLFALVSGTGRECNDLKDGLARLFFFMMKNVQNQFHSRMVEILSTLLVSYCPITENQDKEVKENSRKEMKEMETTGCSVDESCCSTKVSLDCENAIFDIVERTVCLLIDHAKSQHCDELWDCLFGSMKDALSEFKLNQSDLTVVTAHSIYVGQQLSILIDCVENRNGSKVGRSQVKLFQVVLDELLCEPVSEPLFCLTLRLFETLWRQGKFAPTLFPCQTKWFSCIFQSHHESKVYDFIDRLLQDPSSSLIVQDVFPSLLEFVVGLKDQEKMLTLICQIGSAYSLVVEEEQGTFWKVIKKGRLVFSDNQIICKAVNEFIQESLTFNKTMEIKMWAKVFVAVKAISMVYVEDDLLKEIHSSLSSLLHHLNSLESTAEAQTEALTSTSSVSSLSSTSTVSSLSSTSSVSSSSLTMLIACCLSTISKFPMSSSEDGDLSSRWFRWLLQHGVYSPVALKAIQLHMKKSGFKKSISMKELEDFVEPLKNNLRCLNATVRYETLKMLTYYDPLEYLEISGEDGFPRRGCEVLQLCFEIETLCCSLNVEVEREISKCLDRLVVMARSLQTPKIYIQLLVLYSFGLFHVKFASIWPKANQVIAAAASTHFDIIWEIILDELKYVSTRSENSLENKQLHTNYEVTSNRSSTSNSSSILPVAPVSPLLLSIFVDGFEYFKYSMDQESLCFEKNATDMITHHGLVLSVLRSIATKVERKSRIVVPIFLEFLRDQYYVVHQDDDVLKDKTPLTTSPPLIPRSLKEVRFKLKSFLSLFLEFQDMKSLYGHEKLKTLFFHFLIKPDAEISLLALKCLLNYKQKALVPYQSSLLLLVEDASFREEMTKFSLDSISQEDRIQVIPVLIRILYGKFVTRKGKSSKDTLSTRRAAILAFLSGCQVSELAYFFDLILGPFHVQVQSSTTLFTQEQMVMERLNEFQTTFSLVDISKQIGFLNLLRDVIHHMGVKTFSFLNDLMTLLSCILISNESSSGAGGEREIEEDISSSSSDEEDAQQHAQHAQQQHAQQQQEENHEQPDNCLVSTTTPPPSLTTKKKKEVRNLVFRRVSDVLVQFPQVDLSCWMKGMFETVSKTIEHLPSSMIGAMKPSAFLDMLVTASVHHGSLLVLHDQILPSVFSCLVLVPSPHGSIVSSILSILSGLLDYDEEHRSTPILFPRMEQVLETFVLRVSNTTSKGHLHNNKVSKPQKSIDSTPRFRFAKDELALLSRLAEHMYDQMNSTFGLSSSNTINTITHEADVSSSSSSLSEKMCVNKMGMGELSTMLVGLLLPFLQHDRRISFDGKLNLLRIIVKMVNFMDDPSKHIPFLSKLLAPGVDGLRDPLARKQLILVFSSIKTHSKMQSMVSTCKYLEDLNGYDPKKVDEYDFERQLGAYQQLTENNLIDQVGPSSFQVLPIVSHYLQAMHDDEFAIRSASQNALSKLITFISTSVRNDSKKYMFLLEMFRSTMIPCIRFSLKSHSDEVRRNFVQLLSCIADGFQAHSDPSLHGDLFLLRNVEDPEADFFYNITHVQVHRRSRAITRLKKFLNHHVIPTQEHPEQPEQEPLVVLSTSTLVHVILPLLIHFLFESTTNATKGLQQEAMLGIAAVASHLPWSHYYGLIRNLLHQIPRNPEIEGSLVQAVCQIIDAFHFNVEKVSGGWNIGNNTTATLFKGVKKEVNTTVTTVTIPPIPPIPPTQVETTSKIQKVLETNLLPMLNSFLVKGDRLKGKGKVMKQDELTTSGDRIIRVPVALGIVKTLRYLPVDQFHAQLPKLLIVVCKLLRSKTDCVRDAARLTLVKIAVELGMDYLYPITLELKNSLRDGYMVHVLAYTMYSILEALVLSSKTKMMKDTGVDEFKNTENKNTENNNPDSPDNSDSQSKESKESKESIASSCEVCLESIVEILKEDIFGENGKLKEEERLLQQNKRKSNSMKETKICKSYDSFELLAKCIPCYPNPSILYLLNPIVSILSQDDSDRVLKNAQEVFRRVSVGLTNNPNTCLSTMLLYVYNVLSSVLSTCKSHQSKTRITTSSNHQALWQVNLPVSTGKRQSAWETFRILVQPKMTGNDRGRGRGPGHHHHHHHSKAGSNNLGSHQDLLLGYALNLLRGQLKKHKLDGTRTENLEKMDPFVPLLLNCLVLSKNIHIVKEALKCLNYLLHWKLPCLQENQPLVLDQLFVHIQRAASSTRDEVVQACFQTLTLILRVGSKEEEKSSNSSWSLSDVQMRLLINFLKSDMEEEAHQNATFSCMKAILSKKIVLPEVYDLMLRVGELLVQSVQESVRSTCGQIYLTFLLDYPLGKKRLEEQFYFLVSNLEYPFESGRKSTLNCLGALLSKLPQTLLDDRAQFFFLALALRLVNDEASTCRGQVAQVLLILLRRISTNSFLACTQQLVFKWINSHENKEKNNDTTLILLGFQVAGIAMEARTELYPKHCLPNTLQQMYLHMQPKQQQELEVSASETAWKLHYYAWITVEKCLTFAKTSTEKVLSELKGFLDLLVKDLVYPHAWVRLAASRVLGRYVSHRTSKSLLFTSSSSSSSSSSPQDPVNQFLFSQGTLFQISLNCCIQLESEYLDHSLADQTIRNLLFTCTAMKHFPHLQEKSTLLQEKSTLDPIPSHDALGWIFTRLSFIARKSNFYARQSIFQFFAAIITQNNETDFTTKYLSQMINPLYRASQDDTSTEHTEQQHHNKIKLLAQEVLDLIQKKVGATCFLQAYHAVQKAVTTFRDNRKQKRKIEAVLEPQKVALRKLHKNLLKKEQKRKAKYAKILQRKGFAKKKKLNHSTLP